MMWGSGGGAVMLFFMVFVPMVCVAGIVALGWWLSSRPDKTVRPFGPPPVSSLSPRQQLDGRLARGEITVTQYHESRRALERKQAQ